MIAFSNTHFSVISVPAWRLGLSDDRYHGWRWCLHIGPLLISFDPCGPGDCRYDAWAETIWPTPNTEKGE